MEGAVSDVGVCNLAYAGRLEELRAQLQRDRALATKADQDHRTALHWACSAGHADVADLLLGLGVPVSDKDDVSVAALAGLLLHPGEGLAGKLRECRETAGWTPLHIAASAGRDEIVKALIAKGAHVNAVNQNGCTPLHYAASKNKQEIAIMLLENRADPDATDHFKSTPLHRAAAKGNLKMVQILLQHNASVDIQDSEGNTPLHLACDEERVEEAKLLVSHGASIHIENKEELTPLKVAKGGLGAILKRMVEG
ncbi:26S proteasome non-ATPase regulatory subunit 10 isoform 1-T1 [Alca torda]